MSPRLLLAAFALAPLPAAAQPPTTERVLEIFGADAKCPAGYICVRRPPDEQYRIPRAIRENEPTNLPNAQRDLAASTASVAPIGTGTGSCSAIGGGGWTGCWKAEMDAARAAKQADAEAAPTRPQE